MNTPNKRDRLVHSAAELFYHKGMASTSLADIASHAEIPIGNVYYYFKTKEELALAALEKRKHAMGMAYEKLEESISDPRERLIQAIDFFESIAEEYTRYGCPIGKTIMDSHDPEDKIWKAASTIFEDFIGWTAEQFTRLGYEADAKKLALTLIAGIEGAAVLAKAFQDKTIMHSELERLEEWIKHIPNKRVFIGKGKIAHHTEEMA